MGDHEFEKDDLPLGGLHDSSIVENQSSIIYNPYENSNIQLRLGVINVFQNSISFFEKVDENPYSHLTVYRRFVLTLYTEG